MTFLELVQRLHSSSGAGSAQPATVTGAAGEARRLVDWITEADYLIQTRYVNWRFLRKALTTSNVLSAGVSTLAKPADVKSWDSRSFQLLPDGETTKQELEAVEWTDVRDEVLSEIQGVPSRVIIMPDDSLRFDPVPDGGYTVFADYYCKPTRLAADADVTLIPEEYHYSCIVAEALSYYAAFENAPEVMALSDRLLNGTPQNGFVGGMALLENDQLPNQFRSRMAMDGAPIQVAAE